MQRLILAVFSALALASLLALATTAMARDDGRKILEFDTMVGVSGPFKGPTNEVLTRNIPGGGVAWTLKSARGELDANGRLEIRVEGLVFAEANPNNPTGQPAGTNPAATFKGIVSCLSIDAAGAPAIVNVETAPFPAVTGGPGTPNVGDSRIEATVHLPHPCIAPIVFVANGGTGAWFAATGIN